MITFPVLNAFFTPTGLCLHMNEGTLNLPVFPNDMRKQLKMMYKSSDLAELSWEKYFLQNDLEKNVLFERPHVLKSTSQLNMVSYDCCDRGTFDRIVKIVQFFKNSSEEQLGSQALVSYYYDNKRLCSIQACFNFKNTISEIKQYEKCVKATIEEHKALTGWCLDGNSISDNPFGFSDSEKLLNYIKAYRIATLNSSQKADKNVYLNNERCFAYERDEDIYDEVSEMLFENAYSIFMFEELPKRLGMLDDYYDELNFSYSLSYYYAMIFDEVCEKMFNCADEVFKYNAMWQTA